MCNKACIDFGQRYIRADEIRNKIVIEVGSLNVNGSLRSYVESLKPDRYLGVDLTQGPGVDQVCLATQLVERFGKESFDVLVCTEVLEHVCDWRKVIGNLKNIVKPGGLMLITTRSYGFPYHGYPYDFWRYEIDDMRIIFSDIEIEILEQDPEEPGVFMKARKPLQFEEKDLRSHILYSMVKNKRENHVNDFEIWRCAFYFVAKDICLRRLPSPASNFLKRFFPR